MNVRAIAARVIWQIMAKGSSLADCLQEYSAQLKDHRDQALLQAICYGVCRQYNVLQYRLMQLLEKPLKEKDQDITALLLVGLYQLMEMRIPAHAAVAETVAAVSKLKKMWAKGLVNAVLRRYQRDSNQLPLDQTNLEAVFSHPCWMIERIQQSWPRQAEAIFAANNQQAPLVLRVNQRQISREDYCKKLTAANLTAEILKETEQGMVMHHAVDVTALPGFESGDVSVQDGAAQLAASLLKLEPGLRVLDACAAPGGKTAHILEQEPNIQELIAMDHDAVRLQLVRENLRRLHLTAKVIQADATKPAGWWDGQLFDRILLDAPCSATGVIRRHPDIKLLRRASDIARLVEKQYDLLAALWPLLNQSGVLLYATCSVFSQENDELIKRFLSTHSDAKEDKIDSSWGESCSVGRQILPGMHGMDGFYYARLVRVTAVNN